MNNITHLQEKEELIDQLQEQLSMSQNMLKSRTTEFNRAISELDKQTRDPVTAEVVTMETVGLTGAAPPSQASHEQVKINQLKEELEQKDALLKRVGTDSPTILSKFSKHHKFG